MTFCKKLKETTINGKTITAMECTEKYAAAPEYMIIKSENGIGLETIKAARTTWRKKYAQLVDELQ